MRLLSRIDEQQQVRLRARMSSAARRWPVGEGQMPPYPNRGEHEIGGYRLGRPYAKLRAAVLRGLRGVERATATFGRILVFGLLAAAGCLPQGDEACGPNEVYRSRSHTLAYAVCVCDESHGYVFDRQRGYGCRQCEDSQLVVEGQCVSAGSDGGTDGSTSDSGSGDPTGVGEYCESNTDCAEFDAQYCALPTNVCLVENCASGEATCGSSTACCDYSALLEGLSLCVLDTQLVDGGCPMGGTRVER